MPYAQINYSQRLGDGPATIADAGCFLTAYSNLLERFGEPIDPPSLNDYFKQHSLFLAEKDNGAIYHDLLGWGNVSGFDGAISTVRTGTGWPTSSDAIVKFIYKSQHAGREVTHFCLVADANARLIVDSYDGRVKPSPYGVPVGYAVYERHAAQPVPRPVPPEVPSFTVEAIPEREEELKIDTHIWDLNRRNWADMVNNPIGSGNAGTKFKTTAIAHHILGGSYYLPEGSTTQGYNIVDCETPPADPAPAPVATPTPAPQSFTENTVDGIKYTVMDNAPVAMYVTKPDGCEKWSFKNVSSWRDFKSVEHLAYGTQVFIVGSALHPIPPNGAMYYMVDADFGDFKRSGNVTNQYGINRVDLSANKPPALPKTAPVTPPVTVTPPAKIETTPVASSAPVSWEDTYRPFPKPIHYIAARHLMVKELTGQQPDMPLDKYEAGYSDTVGVVSAYGTVTAPDGVECYRLKTNNDPEFKLWYCVPKIDPVSHTPNLLVKPANPLDPVSKANVVMDTLQLAKNRLELDAPKFLDDIIPKWLRNKK